MIPFGANRIRTQEWHGSAKRSAYGQGFRRALAGTLVGDPAPVFARNAREGGPSMRNRFGVVVNSVPYPTPLIAVSQLQRYDGIAPLALQSFISKPLPWSANYGR